MPSDDFNDLVPGCGDAAKPGAGFALPPNVKSGAGARSANESTRVRPLAAAAASNGSALSDPVIVLPSGDNNAVGSVAAGGREPDDSLDE